MNDERTVRGTIVSVVLGTIAVAGIISVAAIVPNALEIYALSKKIHRRYNVRAYLDRTTQRLVDRGLVAIHRRRGEDYAALTQKGKELLARYHLRGYMPRKDRRWDGRWRVIVFDIQERQRVLRDALRQELSRIGFVMLQNSVWVYPYDCQELVYLLRASLLLKKEVLSMTVEHLENDGWLRKHFRLSPSHH